MGGTKRRESPCGAVLAEVCKGSHGKGEERRDV